MSFDIWVDSDSIPNSLKSVILKAAVRLDTAAVFVADRELPDVKRFISEDTHRIRTLKEDKTLKSKIKMVVVSTGADSADNYIVENVSEGSLCITHDIPLASRLLEKKCYVINDRGMSYTSENIKSLLVGRSVNSELREMGVFIFQQSKQGKNNTKEFSDNFDRTITTILKEKK